MRLKLNENQQEMAIAVREILNEMPHPSCEDGWKAYIDFTRAIGKMLNGLRTVLSQDEVKETLTIAFDAYARYWGCEFERILLEALGNNKMLLEHIKEHPNGGKIVNKILDRVKEKNGGVITPGVSANSVQITDILANEMGEDVV